MTDKVQKIRKMVEKLKSNLIYGACSSQIAMETRCKEEAYNEVLAILDTMQEEPVSDTQSPVVLYGLTGSVGNTKEEPQVKESAEIQHVNEMRKENGDSLTQQPVSEELETFAKKESEAFAEREYEIGYIDRNALGKGYYWGCIDGAKWKKEQMMAKAVDGVVTFDYYEGDKAYGCVAHDSFCLEDLGLKDRDEVKILILKK